MGGSSGEGERFVVRDSRVGRNDDLADLVDSPWFKTDTGLDISRVPDGLVVDVGVGGIPGATFSLFNRLKGLNSGLKFVGTELPGVASSAHVVLDKTSFFNSIEEGGVPLSSIVPALTNKEVIEARLAINRRNEPSEILLKIRDSNKERWITVAAEKPLWGRPVQVDTVGLFNRIVASVGRDKIRGMLSGEIADENIKVVKEPAKEMLKSVGADLIETEDLGKTDLRGKVDLMFASHVFMHLQPGTQTDSLFEDVHACLKSGGIFVVKNVNNRGAIFVDVFKKEGVNLVLVRTYTQLIGGRLGYTRNHSWLFGDVGNVVYSKDISL